MERKHIVEEVPERFGPVLTVNAVDSFILFEPARPLDRMRAVCNKPTAVQPMTVKRFIVWRAELVDEAVLELYDCDQTLLGCGRIDDRGL